MGMGISRETTMVWVIPPDGAMVLLVPRGRNQSLAKYNFPYGGKWRLSRLCSRQHKRRLGMPHLVCISGPHLCCWSVCYSPPWPFCPCRDGAVDVWTLKHRG